MFACPRNRKQILSFQTRSHFEGFITHRCKQEDTKFIENGGSAYPYSLSQPPGVKLLHTNDSQLMSLESWYVSKDLENTL